MNPHAFYDHAALNAARMMVGSWRMFGAGIDSPTVAEQIGAVRVDAPAFREDGIHRVKARTQSGDLEAAFGAVRWTRPELPVIIFHHGNNERPFNFSPFARNSLNLLLPPDYEAPVNVVAVEAPFHDSLESYFGGMSRLENFTAMLAASVALTDALIERLRERTAAPVVVAGFSLGGWVVNLHRAFRNTADCYVPLAAGAALDDTVIDSVWHGIVSDSVRLHAPAVRKVLNFEREFAAVPDDNIFPALGRYDQYVRCERQRPSYGNRAVQVYDRGHVTLLAANPELRRHLLSAAGRRIPFRRQA